MNLSELIRHASRKHPHRPAVETTAATLSFAQFEIEADLLAAELRSVRPEENEPVLVLVSNRLRDWPACIAVWKERCVVVPVHRTTPMAAIEDLLERTGARIIVDAEGCFEPLAPEPKESCVRMLSKDPPPARDLLVGAAVIVFTSGTTGRPKGSVLSHFALAGKLSVLQAILQFSQDTRTLLVLQMTFSFGIWLSLLTLMHGGRLTLQSKFDPNAVVNAMGPGGISTVALVPTMIRTILAKQDSSADAELHIAAWSGTKQLIVGGERLGLELHQRVQAVWPDVRLYDVYGTTETGTSDFVLRPDNLPALAGTLGQATSGVEYRVLDESGQDVQASEIGELVIKSKYCMNGYLDEPDLTRDAFVQGYFQSGDLVRMRRDGALEVVGRSKEIISRGGNKISPLEVEATLASHPAVAEAIVAGAPDDRLGEKIIALVVPVAGVAPATDDLISWVAQQLGRFKAPDVIFFGSEVPRGRTGKMDRAEFRRWALTQKVESNPPIRATL